MGAKQSGPATNGRTRAYSGSDLPSNTSSGHSRAAAALGTRYHAYSGTPSAHHGTHGAHGATSSGASPQHNGPSSRSTGGGRSTGASATRTQSGINIPNSRGGAHRSHESAGSTPDETAGERERVRVLFPRLRIVFVEAARVRSQVVQGVCEAITLKVVYQVVCLRSIRNEWEYSYALQWREMTTRKRLGSTALDCCQVTKFSGCLGRLTESGCFTWAPSVA
ncbi:unnamed protein product [Arctogadus glacialis]